MQDYLSDNIWVTTSGNFNDQALITTLLAVGADHIMFASDYPYDMATDAARWIETAPISENYRRKICYANAAALFGLPEVSPRPSTQSSPWPTGPSWPGLLPATRTTANSAESHIHLGNVPPAGFALEPDFQLVAPPLRPAGPTMTQQEVDELIAVGYVKMEAAVTVLSAVKDEQRRPQPGEGGMPHCPADRS